MTDTTLIDILPRRAPDLGSLKLKRWRGLGAKDGHALDGIEHLRQSIIDILTTYPGERVMRPEYGSRIRDLIDRPVNAQWLADLYFEVAHAIQRWEPRVRVQKVASRIDAPGHVVHDITFRLGGDITPYSLQVRL